MLIQSKRFIYPGRTCSETNHGIHYCVHLLKNRVDPKHPIAFFRAIREYEYSIYSKPYLIFEHVYHDFLLELTTLSQLYENEDVGFYMMLRTILNSGIVPLAQFKAGKLYPVRYEEARCKSQELILKALGIRPNN